MPHPIAQHIVNETFQTALLQQLHYELLSISPSKEHHSQQQETIIIKILMSFLQHLQFYTLVDNKDFVMWKLKSF